MRITKNGVQYRTIDERIEFDSVEAIEKYIREVFKGYEKSVKENGMINYMKLAKENYIFRGYVHRFFNRFNRYKIEFFVSRVLFEGDRLPGRQEIYGEYNEPGERLRLKNDNYELKS